MIPLKNIIDFCNTTLHPEDFSDYCYNGLQFEGKSDVKKIALGVSASKQFLEHAAQENCDLSICHHGIIFGKINKIDDILKGRLEILMKNKMSIAGYHLPLDAHPQYGNNIAIAELLGLVDIEKTDIGFTGNFPEPIQWNDFLELIKTKINPDIHFSENNRNDDLVSRICIISGGASGYSQVALENNADTFLFGEIKESAVHEMRERNINYIAAGHYATEVFGVQRLGEAIEKQFSDVECVFIGDDCEV